MDPRFLLDPATGMPAVPMSGGGTLPLALSHDDFRAALAANQTPAQPGGYDPASGTFVPRPPAPMSPEQMRMALQPPPPPPAPAAHASQGPIGPAPLPHGLDPRFNEPTALLAKPQAAPGPGAVDPSELARPGAGAGAAGDGGQQPDPAAGGMDDPLVRQAMAEAVRGGGGGPRGLGVTGETRKFKEVGAVPGEVSAASRDALGASDAYNEQLAISLQQRQEQAYQAYQGEQASRAGELQAQREHFEARQQALQDYGVKRDALAAQAAQMKAPQMEDYWGSRGDMAKMATAVSITLGGALQGLRGGQNPGLEMSNQAIDRWIIGQKEAYQRAQGAVDAADNKYARMVQAFGSEDVAEKHLRDEAWTVRDGMMKAYAEKIGTPNALEAYNQAQLQSEAQRAANLQAAYQSAGAEIEQKLSMQGGGGGGAGVLKMLRAGAEAKTLRDKIAGEGDQPGRAIEKEKVENLTGAINTIDAADQIEKHVSALGYGESDTDDPLSGVYDDLKNALPGTGGKHSAQDLRFATTNLARGIQQSLGKSDNDAKLADQMAEGGGSGRGRIQAARTARQRATAVIQDTLAGMTPDQKRAFIKALPEDRRQRVLQVVGSSAGQAPAASERPF